ncbi:hypothetical protein JZU46_01990 [bacterium]|jgi:hypothetical protein|nr:hypothetical protein [bacterium]
MSKIKKWFCVYYAGFYNLQDEDDYGGKGLLNEDEFGDDIHKHAALVEAAADLLESLQNLVHLHSCEQEGLLSGQPTAKQWIKAVNQAEKAIIKATTPKPKP